ncbi:unnamed protein product [Onchocerca flexuosa]|uniref:Uncharacterized protein n=1 Tax=Onchocerca flexuosa TaxID=387005 RepID=A0A183HSS3_9BILA|nr:unnamed protein product [Onchocerca flexuosa]
MELKNHRMMKLIHHLLPVLLRYRSRQLNLLRGAVLR